MHVDGFDMCLHACECVHGGMPKGWIYAFMHVDVFVDENLNMSWMNTGTVFVDENLNMSWMNTGTDMTGVSATTAFHPTFENAL